MQNFVFRFLLFLTVVCLLACTTVNSQEIPADSLRNNTTAGTIRIFLDCDFCDHSFIKSNIQFVNFTRDSRQAQIHILITAQSTASGGYRFILDFIGRENFDGLNQKLTYISEPSETDDIQRKGLTRTMKMGLMPYISQTPLSSDINISYENKNNRNVQERTKDPWNYWVFSIDLSGDLQAEKSQNELTLSNSLSAERITEEWKFESDFYYRHEQESFKDEEEEIKSSLVNSELTIELVKSLNSHWSMGFFSDFLHSTYTNLDKQVSIAPALEYNFYPWKLSNRKVFTLGYYLGYRYNSYIKETLYDKFSEGLFLHYLEFYMEFVQPWGELDAGINFSQYFHDPKYYRIESEFDVSVRVAKGLSVYMESNIESIHDQIYLPKGDAALEDILLKRRRLETNYDVRFELGIRYTFGSIYNNIVNHRF